jgi:hypothetical protein
MARMRTQYLLVQYFTSSAGHLQLLREMEPHHATKLLVPVYLVLIAG